MKIGRADWAPNYGEQRPLFDADRTTPNPCPVPGCPAIRLPNQTRVPTCRTDQERATQGWTPRPKACLNQPQPTDQIPY